MRENSGVSRASIASKNYVSNEKGEKIEESQTLNLSKWK